jgi:predicted protein tyrosine phosphatase
MNEHNMRFIVVNRETAEEHMSSSRRYAAISITDVGSKEANLKNDPHRAGLIRLQFSDIDADRHPVIPKFANDPYYKDWIVLFSPEMAEKIFTFYKEFKDEVDYFLLHCEAGISRSPAVAAVLCFYETGNDEYFFAKFLPNRYVYRTFIDCLDKMGELEKRARIPRDLSANGIHPSASKIKFID